MNAVIAAARPPDELALERAFERIRTERMVGLPFLNEQLRVEALGFRDWQGVRVGALVTPWAINLVILPAPGTTLPPARTGAARHWQFPSGAYPFDAHTEPSLGAYQQCSLISPPEEFESHAAAVAAARAALEALFAPPPGLSRRGLLLGS
ncbi:MAG TPA: [NiFe]-hydrogenase assembly chaperone HybE [Steroidobacteraceae bacterium]|nr:[NiFe]-hydrogenase assembly chaperone HybE [Steroidobacteraceae bacterium]